MNAIHLRQAHGRKTTDLDVEIVERKGVGPDSVCDAIMEDASRHAPLTETERLVFEVERSLNCPGFKARFPRPAKT
jgi:S-adenosylmethionine synthetase